MLEHTVQPAEFSAGGATAESTSPFDDLASVHALYEEQVFRFLLFSVRDRDLALTLTQDTFLQAWRSRASFRGECSVSTWLMRIAMNLLRSHTRTGIFKFWKKAAATAVDATEMEWQLAHPASSAESSLAAREQLAQVWAAVEKLSPQQRTVFLLRFVEEMEIPEIAATMGASVSAVKSHLYRGLCTVRTAVKEGREK